MGQAFQPAAAFQAALRGRRDFPMPKNTPLPANIARSRPLINCSPNRSLALRLLTALVLLCCLLTPSATFAAATRTVVTTHQAQVSDSQIQQTIQTKLAKSKIGKDGFRFHVSHGVVTWEGNTNVVQHKGAATRMAKAAGASQVVNNIQVSAAAKAKAAKSLKKATVNEN